MNGERLIILVMPVLRLHKLNITPRPHNLDCLRIGVQPDLLSVHPYEMDGTKDRAHSYETFCVVNSFFGRCHFTYPAMKEVLSYPITLVMIKRNVERTRIKVVSTPSVTCILLTTDYFS